MKNNEKGIWISTAIAASAVAAVAAVGYATTSLLVKTALDREEPQIMKKSGINISGGGKNKFADVCADASSKLKGMPHETVKITAHDGVELVGHYFPCEDAKRLIIAFHGWRSSWGSDYGVISDFWHSNGCSVLYAEQRGQNNSGGEYMGFGLVERFDCVDWVRWAQGICGEIPLYLAGISMGATTVLMASDLDFPRAVNGIMADCGFTSPEAIWRHVARNNLHISYGIRSAVASAMCKQRINCGSGDYSTLDALKKTKIPVLFVHGTDDHFVPVEMTYENYKACASPKRLLIVPGADHAVSYCVNRDEYQKAMLDFWADFD